MNPASSVSDSRERLRRLLCSEAIVYAGQNQRIVDYSGRPMPWIYYSWGISLLAEGSSLAAECLIEALSRFESVQVAGIALTGLPLVSAIVAHGSGRYTGLCIRSERERWGTRRQVEGVADRSKPVVVIDDCICSGASVQRAIAALEADGYRVEGAVCLVNFPWKGGMEWGRALGFRMETVFEAWTDLEMMSREAKPGPFRSAIALDAESKVPDGLSPADAARWVAEYFLRCGRFPSPPDKFDREYDAAGGVMVSFRDRRTEYRVARNGFYHMDAAQANLGLDVVSATARALVSSNGAVAAYGLERLKLGVTLFSEHVAARPGDLDFLRYGVLVRSQVQPWKVATALPNTQFFVSEIEQLRHARFTNARLTATEPFQMFRHTVAKSVETGSEWLPYGASDPGEDEAPLEEFGRRMVDRVRQVLPVIAAGGQPEAAAFPAELFPHRIRGIAVSLYRHGMIGCWTSWLPDLDAMICAATANAWRDQRWQREEDLDPAKIDIVVSVFHTPEFLGPATLDRAAFVLRLGKDSLAVRNDQKNSILLAYIPCHNDWSKKTMAEKLLVKAGIEGPPYRWTTYPTHSWLGQAGRVSRLESGYPRRREAGQDGPDRSTVRLLADYIVDKVGTSGLPEYCYYPTHDRVIATQSSARVILALESLLHAGDLLQEASLRQVALRGLRLCCEQLVDRDGSIHLDMGETASGAIAEVFLINALCRSGDRSLIDMPAVRGLVTRLQRFFQADGAVTWQQVGQRLQSDHDLLPGAMLLMAARVAKIEASAPLPRGWKQHLDWYRRRFQLQPNWGMVFWQTQGWAALHELTGEPSMKSFVDEMADWALYYQLDRNGAFMVDYALDGPGFHTAPVLEGIAAAWKMARRAGDSAHEKSYRQSWERGMDFLDRLIIREEDTFAMRKPSRAIGGVRQSLTSSMVRIDFVAHTLLALQERLIGD